MLDERLSCCAEFVRQGRVMADIGTDHAYLPIDLVTRGICPAAIACDLRSGPLACARENIESAGLQNKIRTVLADGLSGLDRESAEDIVIAGMGGHLIVSILQATPWIRDPAKHLVLQPMSDAPALRQWLCENGFLISRERAVQSGRHLYCIMSVFYDGQARTASAAFCRVGVMPQGGATERRYIEREILRLQEKLQGMQRAKEPPEDPKKISEVIGELQRALSQMEE